MKQNYKSAETGFYRTKNKQYNGSEQNSSISSLIINVFKGFLFELIVGILLIVVAAVVVYSTPDPDRIAVPAALTALFLTAFAGGVITVRLNGSGALLCGIFSSLLFIVFIFIVSLFVSDFPYETYSNAANVFFHFALIPLSVLGAYAGLKKKSSTSKRKKKY